jgi:N-methylhydantoinase A
MSLLLGIDIGGTFTDAVALDSATGEFTSTKVPSTPPEFERGFFNSVEKTLKLRGVSSRDIARVVHGTTAATNAIAEQKGARVGILTTNGFEDVIIFGQQKRTEMYNIFYDPETPTFLCDRDRIRGIRERVDYRGNVLVPLNEDDVIEAVDYLVQKYQVQAIAVCYLFSFVNSAHENLTKQIIGERYPELRVSLSSIVSPSFREYDRIVMTAFDAYVGPLMENYLRELENGLKERHVDVILQVMQSRGGVTTAAMCAERPVATLLSGPAAGPIASAWLGSFCGAENLLTLDMGGTTTDVSVLKGGKFPLSLSGKIGKYPLRQAMAEVITIGTGGGSIAWVDPAGVPKVGPQSAGAVPGPACYGLGGTKPTITDASLVLGYIDPEYFAAGEVALHREFAEDAIQKHIATPLGMSVTEAAAAMHRIANNNMADQLRLVSVYKGYHPREFSLVAFGGAGPIAAGRLIELLGIKEAIIPTSPGVFCALGLLIANIEHEEIVSFPVRTDEVDPEDVQRIFRKLSDTCERKRAGVGISETQLQVSRSAEMRYVGQGYELQVSFPEGEGDITKDTIEDVANRFHEVHYTAYQHSAPGSPVEFVTFRTVYWQKPSLVPVLRELSPSAEAVPKGWRKAYFDGYKGIIDTPIYQRTALALGQKLMGPAVVEQDDCTTVIYPNQVAETDKWGNLRIKRADGQMD